MRSSNAPYPPTTHNKRTVLCRPLSARRPPGTFMMWNRWRKTHHLSFRCHRPWVDGAMLSMFVKHTIRGYLSFASPQDISPEKILRHLAAQFRRKNLPREYFICIFLSVLDLKTMDLTYTAAGFQDAPLVCRINGERLKLKSKGLFLSPAFPDRLLNLKEDSIHLSPGTTILFNTDGLTEQRINKGYYRDRLPDIFCPNSHLPPRQIAKIIREDFQALNGGSLQGEDDITFLILQRTRAPEEQNNKAGQRF